jgi:ATP phosphoribosyltransferase regulatory subunit
MAYAKRMNILRVMVIGGNNCSDDEVYIVRVADNKGIAVKKTELSGMNFSVDAEPLQGDC